MMPIDRVAIVITAWVFHIASLCLALAGVIPWQAHWIGTVPVALVIGAVIATDPDVRRRKR
jgi:hypothetical protein